MKNVYEMKIDYQDCYFKELIKTGNNLISFDFSFKAIGAAGAEDLSIALMSENCQLTSLFLYNNDIGDELLNKIENQVSVIKNRVDNDERVQVKRLLVENLTLYLKGWSNRLGTIIHAYSYEAVAEEAVAAADLIANEADIDRKDQSLAANNVRSNKRKRSNGI